MKKNKEGITLIVLVIVITVIVLLVGIVITIAVNRSLKEKKQEEKEQLESGYELKIENSNSNNSIENKITITFLNKKYQVSKGSTILDIKLKSEQGIFTFQPDPAYRGYIAAFLDGARYNEGQTCIVFCNNGSDTSSHYNDLTTYVLQSEDNIGLED